MGGGNEGKGSCVCVCVCVCVERECVCVCVSSFNQPHLSLFLSFFLSFFLLTHTLSLFVCTSFTHTHTHSPLSSHLSLSFFFHSSCSISPSSFCGFRFLLSSLPPSYHSLQSRALLLCVSLCVSVCVRVCAGQISASPLGDAPSIWLALDTAIFSPSVGRLPCRPPSEGERKRVTLCV